LIWGYFRGRLVKKIGVDEATIYNWENNRLSPSLYSIPKIIKFLGYVPFNLQPKTLGGKLLTYRKVLGVSQKELAQKLGVDPSTLARWERDEGKPSKSSLKEIVTRSLTSLG
jgi:transcriptional regulator with XRE-family HTH domain